MQPRKYQQVELTRLGERRKQIYKHAAPASGSNRPTRLRFVLGLYCR